MAETLFADELVDSVRLSLVSGVGPLLRKALIGALQHGSGRSGRKPR